MLLRLLFLSLLLLHVTVDSSKSEKQGVAKRDFHIKSFSEEQRDVELAWSSVEVPEQKVTAEDVEESPTSVEEEEEVEGSGTVEKRSADDDNDGAEELLLSAAQTDDVRENRNNQQERILVSNDVFFEKEEVPQAEILRNTDAAERLLTPEKLVAVKKRSPMDSPVFIPHDEFFNPNQEVQLTDIQGKQVSKRDVGMSLYEEVMNRPRWSDEEQVDERERNREEPVLSHDNETEDSTSQEIAVTAEDVEESSTTVEEEEEVEGSGTVEKRSAEYPPILVTNDVFFGTMDVAQADIHGNIDGAERLLTPEKLVAVKKRRPMDPPVFIPRDEFFNPKQTLVSGAIDRAPISASKNNHSNK